MDNFTFYSPTKFAFGKDMENNAGALVKEFGGSKVLIHFGGGSVVKSGLLDRVKTSLKNADITFVELGGVQPNPHDSKVYEGIEAFRKFLTSIGMPATLKEVGGKEEDIPTLVKNFGLPEGGKTGGFVNLSSEDITNIYKLAL